MTRRELSIIFIAIIAIVSVILFKPEPKVITKQVKVTSTPVQLPPKSFTITQRVPDEIAEGKLKECRVGFHDAIVRINQIQKLVENGEEPIAKDDDLFNADNLAGVYGTCF